MNTKRKKIRFGIIGLGMMGREFGSAVARWCHLLDDCPVPEIIAVCDMNKNLWKWFTDNFDTIKLATADYHELLDSPEVDAAYCAVPHNLHEQVYIDILNAGKHLLGEKPFGIDLKANSNILNVVKQHPELVVRCSSEFPYYPCAQRLIQWVKEKKYGRLIEVRSGFHHSSDMNPDKPINWKRMVAINGEYGCMGDLGMHTHHIPFRMGWIPRTVYAGLLKIIETRPDGKGNRVPCDTWDNAVLLCKALDPDHRKEFLLQFETKRMAPGATNTWFIEVYGTMGSAKFTTNNPRSFYTLTTSGQEQGWTRTDIGSQSAVPTITGSIFETGFSDAFQQMISAFMYEFREDGVKHPFPMVTPDETALSHRLLTAALESHRTGRSIEL